MEVLNILFGFSDENFEAAVKSLLRSKGYDAQIYARFSKESVKHFIEKKPDTDAVVLLEAFPKTKENSKTQKYTAEELAQLTEASDINVIVVLSENYKGTEFMSTLLAAGITGAFFQKRGDGARPRDIASLILQKRTRKSAREYYGIGGQKMELGFLDAADFEKLYTQLKITDSTSLIENFISICSNLTPAQVADFTRRLPREDREYLAQFEEFHIVMKFLKSLGTDLKIKKPRKVSIGLGQPVGISLNDDRIVFDKLPLEAEIKEEKKKVKKKEKKRFVFNKKELPNDNKETSGFSLEETLADFFRQDDMEEEEEDLDLEEYDYSSLLGNISSEDIEEEPSSPSQEILSMFVTDGDVEEARESKAECRVDVKNTGANNEVKEPKDRFEKEQKKTPLRNHMRYMEEEEEEEEEEKEAVVFDEVDDSFDKIVLYAPKSFNISNVLVVLLFLAVLVFVFVYSGNTSLF